MHTGKAIFVQNLDGTRPDGDVLHTEMTLADAAEGQGFESIWFAEHHFGGYHMVPNVVQLLTYLAARTTKVRLGSAVIVLPWHEPVRVAEELSILDQLSGGRLVLGLGRGLGRIEFEGFRLDMSESRQRFLEYAQAIVEAFDTGAIQSDGSLYRQAPTPIRPAPMASLRGRTYASAVSPASMEIMAKLGFGIMVIAQKPWATTEAEIAQYRERFIEINGYEPPKPLLVSFVAVHESEARAKELGDEYIMNYCRSSVVHYEFGNVKLAEVPGYEYYGKFAENIARYGPDTFSRYLADLQICGTPDQVVEQTVENIRRIDGAAIIASLSYGGMPDDVAAENQSLYARAVLPRLQAIDPERMIPGPSGATTRYA
jgi:alkanesulfonate monooxygenase SsuD/methylene tetrahydromethanopterin reductase-like flavin-dependent oxidoreductase (luciferase family)